MSLRRGALIACIAAALGALVAASAAQAPTTIHADVKVTPNKAGTPRHPQGVKIEVHGYLESPEGEERPIFQGGTVVFPRAGVWNGAKYPKCDGETLDRAGLAGCPKGSIIGKGHAVAYADTVITKPKITLVNGGAKRGWAYVVMNNPARVQAPVEGRITKLRKGPWGYRLDFDIPLELQVVAGVPIAGKEIHLTVGKGDIIATTSCPKDRKWRYQATARLSNGQSPTYRGSVPCRPAD